MTSSDAADVQPTRRRVSASMHGGHDAAFGAGVAPDEAADGFESPGAIDDDADRNDADHDDTDRDDTDRDDTDRDDALHRDTLATTDAANDALAAGRAGGRPGDDDASLVALLERIVERDQRAFEAFYDTTCRRVFAMLRRYVRDAARLEEVAEDVFFQVWRDAPRFDAARGRPMAWLLTIARSRALDALRRVERDSVELHVEDDELDAAMEPDDAADPAQRLAESRRADALRAALDTLEPQPRQLVSLAFFRGLTHEEVAAETGLPLGTVKSTIRRALGALRAVLGAALSPDPAS